MTDDAKDDVNEPIELAASVLVHRDDGEIIGFDEADDLVDALNDRVVEFVEACDAVYCAAGSAKLVEKPAVLFEEKEEEERETQQTVPAPVNGSVEVPGEPEVEEEGKLTKECSACHVATTQMDANQCPLCGNPF